MNRRVFLSGSAAAALLGACAPARIPLSTDGDAVGFAPVFVATTRVLDPVTLWPGKGPAEVVTRLSVPMDIDRGRGLVGRSVGPGDARRGRAHLWESGPAFVAALRAEAARQGTREALVFVHGFNNSIDSSLARAAQMAQTFEAPVVPVHFAWASADSPLAYVADRDASLMARDGLEATLGEIRQAGLRPIVLAHSMGAHLVMETLRQMALVGSPVLGDIRGVFLVAPDIDVLVFRSQLRRIPRLPQPFLVLTNSKDRALALSRGLSGRRERLGSLADPAPLADFRITMVDATAVTGGGDHFPVGNSPALAGLLADFAQVPSAFETPAGIQDLLAGSVVGVRAITQVVLEPAGL